MILEIAQIEVKAGMEAAFEEGVTKAAPIFQRARGCKGMELQRSLEQPARYRLFGSGLRQPVALLCPAADHAQKRPRTRPSRRGRTS